MAITSSNQLRMTPYEQAVSRPSYLSYSTNNEHPNSEHLLLKHVIASNDNKAGGINIMTVCGGADNFLSILAKTECPIASLVCVDQNPHQLALGQVKLALACATTLDTEDILFFLGMGKCATQEHCTENDKHRRLQLYHEIIEPDLPASTAALIRKDLLYEIQ